MKIFASLALAGLSGAISVLGWAPFDYWPFVLLGYACLYFLLLDCRAVIQAGLTGLAFGIGLHLGGHGWVFDALHSKVGMPLIPSVIGTAFCIGYLALFTALPSLIWMLVAKPGTVHWRFNRTEAKTTSVPLAIQLVSISAFAALMTLGEWGRSLFFNGFTSLSLGYSLIDTWLSGYGPVVGLYGMSWLAYFICGMTATLIGSKQYFKLAYVVLIVSVTGTGITLNQIEWTYLSGRPLSYRLIQTNVLQKEKFDPQFSRQQVGRLLNLIEQNPADLIVTPETAFIMFLNEMPDDALSRLQQFSRSTASNVFLGVATAAANSDGHNSVIRIAPGQDRIEQYDKIRLMPFGEYSPIGFGWFTNSLHIALKDLTAGTIDQPPFTIGAQAIGTVICHEDLIGREVRRWSPVATLLLNPSNLAWFDGSLAIGQRLQIVRMRALESGRPILRVANTGITVHIDHHGKVTNLLPAAKEGVLKGVLQPVLGLTPYARYGDGSTVLGSGLLLLFVGWIRVGVWKNRR